MYMLTVSRKELKEFYKKDKNDIEVKKGQSIDIDLLPVVKLLNKIWQFNYNQEN